MQVSLKIFSHSLQSCCFFPDLRLFDIKLVYIWLSEEAVVKFRWESLVCFNRMLCKTGLH